MGIEGDVFLGPREEGGERKVVIVGDNSQKQAVGQQPQVTEGGEEGDWRRKSVSGRRRESLLYGKFSKDWCWVNEYSKRRTSSGDRGGRGRECETVHTLDIHPEALRFTGKDAWEAVAKGMQIYTHSTIKGGSFLDFLKILRPVNFFNKVLKTSNL